MTEHKAGSLSNPPDSVQIVEALAEHIGSEPTEVDFTLYDYVNPEALDDLLDSDAGELVVAFEIEDKVVTVTNDGTIEIVNKE